jgi:hypothetical protein
MSEPIGYIPEELREELQSHDDEVAIRLRASVESFFPSRYPYVNREWFDGVRPPNDELARGKVLIFSETELAEAKDLDKHSSMAIIIRAYEDPNPTPEALVPVKTGFAINYYNSPEPPIPPSRRVKGTTVYAPGQSLREAEDVDFALEKTRIFQEGITIDEEFENQPFGWDVEQNKPLTLKEVVEAHQTDIKNAQEAKKKKQPALQLPDRSVVTLFDNNPDTSRSLVLARIAQNPTYTTPDGNTYTSESVQLHLETQTDLARQVMRAELVRIEAYESLLKRMKLL